MDRCSNEKHDRFCTLMYFKMIDYLDDGWIKSVMNRAKGAVNLNAMLIIT